MTDADEPTYFLTIPQVAKMLSLSKSSAYQLAQHGQYPFVPGVIEVETLGESRKRCRMADVEAFARGNRGHLVAVPPDL